MPGSPTGGIDVGQSDMLECLPDGLSGSSSVVEPLPSKQVVVGSSPISRSTKLRGAPDYMISEALNRYM